MNVFPPDGLRVYAIRRWLPNDLTRDRPSEWLCPDGKTWTMSLADAFTSDLEFECLRLLKSATKGTQMSLAMLKEHVAVLMPGVDFEDAG